MLRRHFYHTCEAFHYAARQAPQEASSRSTLRVARRQPPLHCRLSKLLPRRSAHLPSTLRSSLPCSPVSLTWTLKSTGAADAARPQQCKNSRGARARALVLCQPLLLHAALEHPRARQSGETERPLVRVLPRATPHPQPLPLHRAWPPLPRAWPSLPRTWQPSRLASAAAERVVEVPQEEERRGEREEEIGELQDAI